MPLFADLQIADTTVVGLLDDHRFYKAHLYAFVVMPEHIHLLTTLPKNLSVSQFANRIKSAAANRSLPLLSPDADRDLTERRTQKNRKMWQRSFRSVVIDQEWAFLQKIEYIHRNPVLRGLCANPSDYRWSSAALYERGLVSEEGGVSFDAEVLKCWPLAVRSDLHGRRPRPATRGRVAG